MADDTDKRFSPDQDAELRRRSRSLGCTEEELREAIKAVANLISLEHDGEIRDWAMGLCCTEAELLAAVRAVGNLGEALAASDPLLRPGEFNDV